MDGCDDLLQPLTFCLAPIHITMEGARIAEIHELDLRFEHNQIVHIRLRARLEDGLTLNYDGPFQSDAAGH